jgi:hypothetical protein
MLLSAFVQRAMDPAPLAVMAYASLEKALDPHLLNDLFEQQAEKQYTRILLLSDLVDLMAQVVCRSQPSLRQAYLQQPLDASLSAVYAKLAGLEPPIAQRLVRDTADRLGGVLDLFQPKVASWFRGYQVRILDGNVLKNTPHRLKVLRSTRASALAGVSVTVLDPERN